MGRGNKRGGGRGGGRGGNKSGGRGGSRGDGERWVSSQLNSNETFENYYKAQKIIPEAEWDAFMTGLREPLPTTFRITGSRPIASAINEMIKAVFVPYLTGIEHEGALLSPPQPLGWYPDRFAWQLNIGKHAIRKNDKFKKFQHFLVYETDAGNISRQEAVSMIPPLLLDVKPQHHVLDMCAAPGSKSVQLLEALHTLAPSDSDDALKRVPPGLLIANDSDAKRCHMLVHQSLHRVPASGMMVTNHDATQLPGYRLPSEFRQEGDKTPVDPNAKKYKPLLFDRILADVPCSGDGTLRKNVQIWKDFTPGNGIGLHSLQLRILMRGVALLKPGGRLVYSTCSMNPVENEAVVSAALSLATDLSIVDVPDLLPGLVRRPGLTDWIVLDNKLQPAPHPTDPAASAGVDDKRGQRKTWSATLWPKGDEKEKHMERCLRLYPHLQDTGSFFVCVLEKAASATETEVEAEAEVAPAPEVAAPEVAAETAKRPASPSAEESGAKRTKAEEATDAAEPINVEAVAPVETALSTLPAEAAGAPTRTQQEFKEEPYIYLNEDDEQVKLCADFFDLAPNFPASSLLVRNAEGKPLRSMYFTNQVVRSLLLNNSYKRMRLISCGVKLFTRQDSSKEDTYRCKWRVVSEGLEVIRPFMGPKRLITANEETLRALMTTQNVAMDKIKEEAFVERLKEMEPGSCVLEIITRSKDVALDQKLCLPFWKSKVSVNLMVEKVEKSALSLRLYGEDITPHAPNTRARDERRAEATAKAAAEAKAVAGEGVEAKEEGAAVVEEAVQAEAGEAGVAVGEVEAKVEV